MKKRYYSEKEHFITDIAILNNIIYDEEKNAIYFWLTEIDDSYQDSTFKIEGKSALVALERGILEKMEIGNEIEYISAPGYFGDGYCMPIVAISIDGEKVTII